MFSALRKCAICSTVSRLSQEITICLIFNEKIPYRTVLFSMLVELWCLYHMSVGLANLEI